MLHIHHWNLFLQSNLTNCCTFIIGIFYYNLTLQTALHSSLESFLQSYLTNCCTFVIGIFFTILFYTAVHSSLEYFLQSYLTKFCTFIIRIFYYNITLQTAVHSTLESFFTILPFKLLYIYHWNLFLQSYFTLLYIHD